MGTKLAQEAGATVTHPASTAWIPRAVRCARCGELAREEVRERMSDEEVAVRYGCPHCRWRQTRHYHENEH
jgi:lysyl-tRNA synthetase class I